MSNVLIYDKTTGNALQYLICVNTPDYKTRDDAIINPDLSAVKNVPVEYLKVQAGAVAEMTATEKAAVDAAKPAPVPDPVEQLRADVEDLKKRVAALEKP